MTTRLLAGSASFGAGIVAGAMVAIALGRCSAPPRPRCPTCPPAAPAPDPPHAPPRRGCPAPPAPQAGAPQRAGRPAVSMIAAQEGGAGGSARNALLNFQYQDYPAAACEALLYEAAPRPSKEWQAWARAPLRVPVRYRWYDASAAVGTAQNPGRAGLLAAAAGARREVLAGEAQQRSGSLAWAAEGLRLVRGEEAARSELRVDEAGARAAVAARAPPPARPAPSASPAPAPPEAPGADGGSTPPPGGSDSGSGWGSDWGDANDDAGSPPRAASRDRTEGASELAASLAELLRDRPPGAVSYHDWVATLSSADGGAAEPLRRRLWNASCGPDSPRCVPLSGPVPRAPGGRAVVEGARSLFGGLRNIMDLERLHEREQQQQLADSGSRHAEGGPPPVLRVAGRKGANGEYPLLPDPYGGMPQWGDASRRIYSAPDGTWTVTEEAEADMPRGNGAAWTAEQHQGRLPHLAPGWTQGVVVAAVWPEAGAQPLQSTAAERRDAGAAAPPGPPAAAQAAAKTRAGAAALFSGLRGMMDLERLEERERASGGAPAPPAGGGSGSDADPPAVLRVSGWRVVNGDYPLMAEPHAGMPQWGNAKRRIYSAADGTWTVTEDAAKEMPQNNGSSWTLREHGGRMPHELPWKQGLTVVPVS
eukprot:TRINITY_DN2658_c2_g4_i1.p1 TRINITY_DN2658_c2_g4~~TRINITY_DN2658_c2_g4_i1.p1  ORF type:complete len:693 (+),score=137.01 TRINITY_DN2658_c2_g4_i1:134-2080(+)